MLSPSAKAQAIALLLQGKNAVEVAKEVGVPRSVAERWAEEVRDADLLGDHREEMARLLVFYMREALETLVAQQRIFRDPDWIRLQVAAGIAELHGTTFDRTLRLFQALSAPAPAPREEAGDKARAVPARDVAVEGSEARAS